MFEYDSKHQRIYVYLSRSQYPRGNYFQSSLLFTSMISTISRNKKLTRNNVNVKFLRSSSTRGSIWMWMSVISTNFPVIMHITYWKRCVNAPVVWKINWSHLQREGTIRYVLNFFFVQALFIVAISIVFHQALTLVCGIFQRRWCTGSRVSFERYTYEMSW